MYQIIAIDTSSILEENLVCQLNPLVKLIILWHRNQGDMCWLGGWVTGPFAFIAVNFCLRSN